MLAELPEKSIRTIRDAASRLTGAARRKFEAASGHRLLPR